MTVAPNIVNDAKYIDDSAEPDLETASNSYAARFSGAVGQYFLDVQTEAVRELLPKDCQGLKVLEVGGGHGQLTQCLLELGCEVWVHGSAKECFQRLHSLKQQHPDRLHFTLASMFSLPFKEQFFDVVIAVRLISHVPKYELLLSELSRVTRDRLLIDYPPLIGFNLLYPIFFTLKRLLEGNTRTFICFHAHKLDRILRSFNFRIVKVRKQFFVPMVIHRKLKSARASRSIEGFFRVFGLTACFGSPAIFCAQPFRAVP